MIPVTTKDRITFWATTSVYGIVVLFLVVAFSNRVHSHYLDAKFAGSLYSTKWYLYTKSPVAKEQDLYECHDGRFRYVDLRPFTSAYAFGMDRRPKVIAQEVIAITHDTAIARHAHHLMMPGGRTDPLALSTDADKMVYTTIARSDIKLLRGKYLIVVHPPLLRHAAEKPIDADIIAVNIIDP